MNGDGYAARVAELAGEAMTVGADLVPFESITPERVGWLWAGWLPTGKLVVLEGDPGVGKSTLGLAIAARLSRGEALPGTSSRQPVASILCSYEDGAADTLRPRLDAAGGDPGRVFLLRGVRDPSGGLALLAIPDHVTQLREAVDRTGAGLIVVDPLAAALSGAIDSYRDADVRRALAPLAALAEETGVAVLVVRHLVKRGGARAIVAGGGSIGIAGAARAVWLADGDPDSPGDLVLAPVKSNLGRPPAAIRYRVVDRDGVAAIEWRGASPRTAAELTAIRGAEAEAESPEVGAWLRDFLSCRTVERAEIIRAARAAGFAERSVDRAAARLRVDRQRSGFGATLRSTWSLPAIPAIPADPPVRAGVAEMEGVAEMDNHNGLRGRSEAFPAIPANPAHVAELASEGGTVGTKEEEAL